MTWSKVNFIDLACFKGRPSTSSGLPPKKRNKLTLDLLESKRFQRRGSGARCKEEKAHGLHSHGRGGLSEDGRNPRRIEVDKKNL